MSELHLVGGEKGGVGKSVMARLIAQYWIDRGILWTGFDTDRSHGALLRYYSEYAEPIEITKVEDLDRLIEVATHSDRRLLVDLAAQTERDLHAWVESGDVLELAREAGIKLVFWHVMDDGKDSLDLLTRLFDRYGDRASYVVVLNKGRGEDFSLYRDSEAAKFVADQRVPVMELNALHKATMRKIDHLDKSFWAAVHHKDQSQGDSLGLMERQRAKVWLRQAYGELDRVGM